MTALHNYDPSQVFSNFGPVLISGYAEGTFIEVERDEDGFTSYVGALGDVARVRNLNRMTKVTLTLMATAPCNDLLMALALQDEATGLNIYPMSIKDLNGTMFCMATDAWVMKMPKVERGKEAGTVQWVFQCANMLIEPGGNLF